MEAGNSAHHTHNNNKHCMALMDCSNLIKKKNASSFPLWEMVTTRCHNSTTVMPTKGSIHAVINVYLTHSFHSSHFQLHICIVYGTDCRAVEHRCQWILLDSDIHVLGCMAGALSEIGWEFPYKTIRKHTHIIYNICVWHSIHCMVNI